MGSEPVYDVIVVGSGAAGGMAAYLLATKGLNVLCLEAGRMIDPAKDFHTHKFPYEWPNRGRGKPGEYGHLPQGMEWKIKEWTDQLYTIPSEDPYAVAPGSKFTWTRLRAVGGRTLLWGRGVDRFGPLDFKAKSQQDGWGEDWPITYEDIEPYYDKVETLIGCAGGSENVFNTPAGQQVAHSCFETVRLFESPPEEPEGIGRSRPSTPRFFPIPREKPRTSKTSPRYLFFREATIPAVTLRWYEENRFGERLLSFRRLDTIPAWQISWNWMVNHDGMD